MDVLVLNSLDGEWIGLFVNGNLEEESHSFSNTLLLEKSEIFGFKSKDIRFLDVTEEDDEYLIAYGSFPNKLKELKGNYNI